jgi:hypothetical protein
MRDVGANRRAQLARAMVVAVVAVASIAFCAIHGPIVPIPNPHVYWGEPDEARQARDAQRLRAVLPVLEKLGVLEYENLDWCRAISLPQGVWTDPAEGCGEYMPMPAGDVPYARAAFAAFSDTLDHTGVWVNTIRLTVGAGGKITNAEFHLNGWLFADNYSYVYDPGYTLPEDMPNELVYKRIDSDWYYFWEDWN